ncbi:oligopeptide/dipeptide ABC transporter ATP-binding protein [Mesorhizobium ciceri]|nr:oligopeptide/dipeptide ABC transporter ATP-binding protein [Mesorhizobium ciceri]
MYAGSIVEEGPVSEVFSAPSHPYTSALIKSVPPLDIRLESGLVSIEGRPPDLADKQIGCAFCPRCSSKIEKCIDQRPPLRGTGLRKVACWVAGKEQASLGA